MNSILYFESYRLRWITLSLLCVFLISGCTGKLEQQTAVVNEPVSDAMTEALLSIEDMPLPGEWRKATSTSPHDWNWSKPINVVTRHFSHAASVTDVEHTIVQYPSEDMALDIWKRHDRAYILPEISPSVSKVVSLLPDEEAPSLYADNVLYRCEEYYKMPKLSLCIARLRYGRYYTHVFGSVAPGKLSPQQFYELVSIVDEHMQALIASEKQTPPVR